MTQQASRSSSSSSLSSARPPRWRADLAWVLGGALATYGLSVHYELHERMALLFQRLERWQVDELPLTLVSLSLGLAWYAWRRRRESVRLLTRNRELAQQLIALQEHERLALARELHDEFAQHCTAIRFEATYLQRARDMGQVGLAAQRIADSAEQLHGGVRRLLRRLRPAELDELGLVAAVDALCADWSARSGTHCAFDHEGPLAGLGEAVDTALYRVTQEALANVMRHAQAREVRVRLSASAQGLALSVQDDGRGFAEQAAAQGLGLRGAAERAAALGGRLETDNAPGAGARLRLWLPQPSTNWSFA